jgi:putative nucleotidyltransferase with HDIG domain
MARDMVTGEIIDLFGGRADLNAKRIRAVGNAKERFAEDPLRMLRAIRFASQLGFKNVDVDMPEPEKLKNISKERISAEISKILLSPNPVLGISLLRKFGLMKYIIPDFEKLYGLTQNKYHYTDVYNHTLDVITNANKCSYKGQDKLIFMLAALLHDIGKPDTKSGEGDNVHFYDHEDVGFKKTKEILQELRFDNDIVNKVSELVSNHMRLMNAEPSTKTINRLVRELGKEQASMLIDLSDCDASSTKEPRKDKTAKFKEILNTSSLSEDKIQSPLTGEELMSKFKIKPGRIIGQIKDYLTDKVTDGELKPGDKENAYKLANNYYNNISDIAKAAYSLDAPQSNAENNIDDQELKNTKVIVETITKSYEEDMKTDNGGSNVERTEIKKAGKTQETNESQWKNARVVIPTRDGEGNEEGFGVTSALKQTTGEFENQISAPEKVNSQVETDKRNNVSQNKDPYFQYMEKGFDPDSPDILNEIDSIIKMAHPAAPPKQQLPRGCKQIAEDAELSLYNGMRHTVNTWFDSLQKTSDINISLADLRLSLVRWNQSVKEDAINDINKLHHLGYKAGLSKAGLKEPTHQKKVDYLVQNSKGIGPALDKMRDNIFNDISKTLSKYKDDDIPLFSVKKEIDSKLKDKRNDTRRMIRTEVAKSGNLGLIEAWNDAPNKYMYKYFWNAVNDSNTKKISKMRESGNPWTFDEIRILWHYQKQFIDKDHWENDVFFQRCSLSRESSEFEFKGNRFSDRMQDFEKTL